MSDPALKNVTTRQHLRVQLMYALKRMYNLKENNTSALYYVIGSCPSLSPSLFFSLTLSLSLFLPATFTARKDLILPGQTNIVALGSMSTFWHPHGLR